jgi:hypothetical protein
LVFGGPAISIARLEMTSFTFILDWVPEPVCHTRRGNSSSSFPSITYPRELHAESVKQTPKASRRLHTIPPVQLPQLIRRLHHQVGPVPHSPSQHTASLQVVIFFTLSSAVARLRVIQYLLQESQRPNNWKWDEVRTNVEVLERSLSLSTPITSRLNIDGSHGIRFHAKVGHDCK